MNTGEIGQEDFLKTPPHMYLDGMEVAPLMGYFEALLQLAEMSRGGDYGDMAQVMARYILEIRAFVTPHIRSRMLEYKYDANND